MRVYIVNPLKDKPEIRDVNVRDEDGHYDHAEFKKIIECEHLDYTGREVEGHKFDICVDDFFNSKNREISALNSDFMPVLAGTIIFTHHDDEDIFADLTDEEIEVLLRNTRIAPFKNKATDEIKEYLVIAKVDKPQLPKFDFGDINVVRIKP